MLARLLTVAVVALGSFSPAAAHADTPSGKTLSWGANDTGQLGTGAGPSSLASGVLSSVDHIKAIASGANHTIALLDDGTVWAWGRNDRGQLGFAPPASDERGDASDGRAVQVPYLSAVVAIAAGNAHNLALESDGTIWAWGDNTWGQLGNGHPNADDLGSGGTAGLYGYSNSEPVPVPVSGLAGVTAVAAGGNRSLALLSDGTVQQWGEDTTAFGADWLDPLVATVLTGVVPLPFL